jgi:hypothetical protein
MAGQFSLWLIFRDKMGQSEPPGFGLQILQNGDIHT